MEEERRVTRERQRLSRGDFKPKEKRNEKKKKSASEPRRGGGTGGNREGKEGRRRPTGQGRGGRATQEGRAGGQAYPWRSDERDRLAAPVEGLAQEFKRAYEGQDFATLERLSEMVMIV